MTAWQIVASALGVLWLLGSPAGVWLWIRHEVHAEQRAEAAERAAEDDFVRWAAELDDTIEFP